MKYLVVLGESRKPSHSAVIEKGSNAERHAVFRVTVCRRFYNLDDAISYYLKAAGVVRRAWDRVDKEIRYNAKKRVRESTDSI